MGSAFTPGLTISDNVTIRKTRRLPVKGEVIVKIGDSVDSTSVVAKVDLPGTLAVIKAAPLLGCAPELLRNFCLVSPEETVERDQLVAMRKVFFGFVTNRARSPIDGTVEYISNLSGNIGVRGKPKPLSCNAFVSGKIVEVLEEEGVVVETTGALVQGIFGVGGERHGKLEWIDNNSDVLTAADISQVHRDKILLHRGRLDGSVFNAVIEHGVLGLIGASIIDSELMSYLGFDIGVAVTGEEDIPFSLIVTEGFGQLIMPDRTEKLLRILHGSHAAINGATQIRAGVIRPELIVSRDAHSDRDAVAALELKIGSRVRLIRRPNFGKTGIVTALPEQPQLINTGSLVRVTTVQLDDAREVTIPRANIEILD